jgi:hypothetical protein
MKEVGMGEDSIGFFNDFYSFPLDICQRLVEFEVINEYEEGEMERCLYCFASLFERMVQSPHFVPILGNHWLPQSQKGFSHPSHNG